MVCQNLLFIIWVSRVRFSKRRVLKRKVKGRLLQYCPSSGVVGRDFTLSRIRVFTIFFSFKCLGYVLTYTSPSESWFFFLAALIINRKSFVFFSWRKSGSDLSFAIVLTAAWGSCCCPCVIYIYICLFFLRKIGTLQPFYRQGEGNKLPFGCLGRGRAALFPILLTWVKGTRWRAKVRWRVFLIQPLMEVLWGWAWRAWTSKREYPSKISAKKRPQ